MRYCPLGKEVSEKNVIGICWIWLLTMLGNIVPKNFKFSKEQANWQH